MVRGGQGEGSKASEKAERHLVRVAEHFPDVKLFEKIILIPTSFENTLQF